MKPKITFEYEGKNYQVGSEAYDTNLIKLPDSRILHVGAWLESYPPQPTEMEDVTEKFINAEEI